MCIPPRAASHPPPSPVAAHLGVVHVPEKVVGLGVQNEVPPQKLAAVLILLDVQEPTDSVLPIHIRHSWALLTSPCMAGGRKGGRCWLRRRVKWGLPQGLREPRSGSTHLWEKLDGNFLRQPLSPRAPNIFPSQTLETFHQSRAQAVIRTRRRVPPSFPPAPLRSGQSARQLYMRGGYPPRPGFQSQFWPLTV